MATIPNDLLFNRQWYLKNDRAKELDLNVVDVWDDYTGAGVKVAVVDRAVQGSHPDLFRNYENSKAWDFQDDDNDFNGDYDSHHGTAAAGIIAASKGNDIGVVGVSYGAKVFGFRYSAQDFVASVTAAIDNASGRRKEGGVNREADIVNLSIGTIDNNGSVKGSFDKFYSDAEISELNKAIDYAASSGRGGLGTILVKAAGNQRGKSRYDDTNLSSWNANIHTISVAAVDRNGFVSSSSSHGASLLVSGFGPSGEIETTDLVGSEGKSNTDYYSNFNGTSAAAPMVSGVIALMLEANPNLSWRDVQEILAYSARHVGSEVGENRRNSEKYDWSFNRAKNWNGGGLHFSNDYGFGLVDTKAAVRLAETWESKAQANSRTVRAVGNFLNSKHIVGGVNDSQQAVSSFSKTIGSGIDIEHVEVDINFSESSVRGDLTVRLIAPGGRHSSFLIKESGSDFSPTGAGRWKFTSNAFRGEDASGRWRIELIDGDSATSNTPILIDNIDVTFRGWTSSENDKFIFTEEYSDYAGGSFHTKAINGGAGNDTINAAAVDSNTTVNLSQGTGSIDGVNITVSGIENVFTGDGNDRLIGNGNDNTFRGGAGNDFLRGYYGSDKMYGGTGDDRYFVHTGGDQVIEKANEGTDTIYTYLNYNASGRRQLEANVENLGLVGNATIATGNELDNEITANSSGRDSFLYGQDGDDQLLGRAEANRAGNETMYGGAGNDLLRGYYGSDKMYGGTGDDRYFVHTGGDQVIRPVVK